VLFKLAWRNIWRNTRRTIISVLALALGVTAIVSMRSIFEVAVIEMARGITTGLIGHAQVHGRGYQDLPEMTNLVADPATVEAKLKSAVPGATTERRVIGAGLAGSTDVSTAVAVLGIDAELPSAKALLTIEQGRGLDAARPHEIVIGTGLARELGLVPGGEMILVGQAADGSLANDRYTVAGTADAGSSEANQSTVFMRLADAQSFFGLDQGVHQIIVRLPADEEDLSRPVSLLGGALDLSSLEVLPWTSILPELKGALDAKRKNMRLIDLIVFLIVSLGILNTMTMSTFERTREFGVMASLGTRPRRVLGMVLLEALMQGVIGLCAGVALAWLILHGIGTLDYSGLTGGTDVLGARLPPMRLSVTEGPVAEAALVTFVTMLVGALAPAIRAARLKPVEATRYV
jgi:ABC-type lipoprotein release transport system permease subunit